MSYSEGLRIATGAERALLQRVAERERKIEEYDNRCNSFITGLIDELYFYFSQYGNNLTEEDKIKAIEWFNDLYENEDIDLDYIDRNGIGFVNYYYYFLEDEKVEFEEEEYDRHYEFINKVEKG